MEQFTCFAYGVTNTGEREINDPQGTWVQDKFLICAKDCNDALRVIDERRMPDWVFVRMRLEGSSDRYRWDCRRTVTRWYDKRYKNKR